MLRTHRDQYTDKNIDMDTKIFYELRLELVSCHLNRSTSNVQVKKIFLCSFLQKNVFGHKYIILAMLNLESIVTCN